MVWTMGLDARLDVLVHRHMFDFDAVAEEMQEVTNDDTFDAVECRTRFSLLDQQSDRWAWSEKLENDLRVMARLHEFDFQGVSQDITQLAQLRGLCADGAIVTPEKCRLKYFELDAKNLLRRRERQNAPAVPKAAVAESVQSHPDEVFSKIRHNFYQTNAEVVVSLLQKGVSPEHCDVQFGQQQLNVTLGGLPDRSRAQLKIHLHEEVVAAECKCKVLGSKVELRLQKLHPGSQWPALEGSADSTGGSKEAVTQRGNINSAASAASAYASKKDWNKVGKDIERELEKESKQELAKAEPMEPVQPALPAETAIVKKSRPSGEQKDNMPFPEEFKPSMSDVEKLLARLGGDDDDDDSVPVSRADLLKKMFASDGQEAPEDMLKNSMPLPEDFTKMFE